MAVTKKAAWSIVLPVSAGLILAFQNCAVELSENTYGADTSVGGSCSPTDAELMTFAAANTVLTSATSTENSGQGCYSCHGSASGIYKNVFSIDNAGTPAANTRNWCAAKIHADNFASGWLTSGHAGGTYNMSVQDIVSWANSL